MGFRVWGLGFEVWSLGFRVWVLVVWCWWFGVWGLGFGGWGCCLLREFIDLAECGACGLSAFADVLHMFFFRGLREGSRVSRHAWVFREVYEVGYVFLFLVSVYKVPFEIGECIYWVAFWGYKKYKPYFI